jgi:uncharacterized repeat protein (TIGR03803 family)
MLVGLLALLSPAAAGASGLTTLHTFTGADGSYPGQAMVLYNGLLYGTTAYGGTSNNGTVFTLDPKTGLQSVLYSFAGGADAALPQSPLVYHKGALYGLSYFGGGTSNQGTVFKFDLATGTETVVHGFSGTEGSFPRGSLVISGADLYGTTTYGGTHLNGTLFRVSLAKGKVKVLHAFASGADGAGPEGGLTNDAGTIYGTTLTGGASSNGTIFELNPKTRAYKVLYSFTVASGGGSNGVLLAHDGVLYGTGPSGAFGSGCVFKFNPTTLAETVLYSFTGFADGSQPYAGVIYHSGALYGSTSQGGTSDNGTLYKLELSTGSETVLYSFSGGSDGLSPGGPLVYTARNYFGSTAGGTDGFGTLFEFVN